MSEPFLGEIKMMSFSFPPKGWAQCNGALLPINQNQALFALLGTQYGGNGTTTFALPDLRGRAPVHVGAGIVQGQAAGSETVTLTMTEMPTHSHAAKANSAEVDVASPLGAMFGSLSDPGIYHQGSPDTQLADTAITQIGGSQPHNNMQPFSVVNFCIAIQGIFPSRN